MCCAAQCQKAWYQSYKYLLNYIILTNVFTWLFHHGVHVKKQTKQQKTLRALHFPHYGIYPKLLLLLLWIVVYDYMISWSWNCDNIVPWNFGVKFHKKNMVNIGVTLVIHLIKSKPNFSSFRIDLIFKSPKICVLFVRLTWDTEHKKQMRLSNSSHISALISLLYWKTKNQYHFLSPTYSY